MDEHHQYHQKNRNEPVLPPSVKKQTKRLAPSVPPTENKDVDQLTRSISGHGALGSTGSLAGVSRDPSLYGSRGSLPHVGFHGNHGMGSTDEVTLTTQGPAYHKRSGADHVKSVKQKYQRGAKPVPSGVPAFHRSAENLNRSTENNMHGERGSVTSRERAGSWGNLSYSGGYPMTSSQQIYPQLASDQNIALANQVAIAGTPAIMPSLSVHTLNGSVPSVAYISNDMAVSQEPKYNTHINNLPIRSNQYEGQQVRGHQYEGQLGRGHQYEGQLVIGHQYEGQLAQGHYQSVNNSSNEPHFRALPKPYANSSPRSRGLVTTNQNGHIAATSIDRPRVYSRSSIEEDYDNNMNASSSTLPSTIRSTQHLTYNAEARDPKQWPSIYFLIISAIFAVINPILGGVSIFFSMKSYTNEKKEDWDGVKSNGHIAVIFGLIGVVITVVLVIILTSYYTP